MVYPWTMYLKQISPIDEYQYYFKETSNNFTLYLLSNFELSILHEIIYYGF